jgi:hypothetical protein
MYYREDREASPHQTIDINVHGIHWSYHFDMAPEFPIGFVCTSVELQKGPGDLPGNEEELFPKNHIIFED